MLDKLFTWLWVKHPRLQAPDAMLTFSAITLLVCSIKVVLNDVVITIGYRGSHTINCGHVDATVIAAMLGPTVLAYVQRKRQDPPDKNGGSST